MKKITLILITLLMLTCFSSAATLKKTIGTVSVSTTIPEGRQITLRYAQDVTNFVKWIVRTENVTLTDETATTITFTMPATDVEIIADDGQLLELSVSIDGELMETTQRYVGESVTVTAVEKEGVEFKEWSITGLTGVDTTSNPLTFTMPSNNVEIVATFGVSIVIANSEVPVGAYIEYVPTATNVLESSCGVEQNFNPSNTTSWQVMYNNNGQLDIISAEPVCADDGLGLILRYKVGYAKAVGILNNVCNAYANSDIATGGRSVGSTNNSIDIIDESIITYGVTGIPYEDTEYENDVNQLENNGLLQSDRNVWLASRFSNGYRDLGLYWLSIDGVINYAIFGYDDGDDYEWDISTNLPIRPVVSLTSDIQIVGGTGVADDPYKIEVASGCTHNFSRVCNVNGETDTIQCSNCTYTEIKTCNHNYYITKYIEDSQGSGTVIFSSTTVKAGGSIMVTVTPDSGSGVDVITITDEDIGIPEETGGTYTINNITENKEVFVSFCVGADDGGE